MIRWLLLAMVVLPIGLAQAQFPEDPAAQMVWFQEMEETILQNRQALLDREAELDEPLWLTRSDGTVHVVDGTPIYDRAELLVDFAVANGVTEALPQGMPDFIVAIANAAGEAAAKDRAERIREQVVEAYRSHSADVRAQAMIQVEEELELVQEGFAEAMARRDAGEDADWRVEMEGRGASLPVGAVLVNPVPDLNIRECRAPAEVPIWIQVADPDVCTGNWDYRGWVSEFEGVTAYDCVWCPSGMYWRSGWGCCVNE